MIELLAWLEVRVRMEDQGDGDEIYFKLMQNTFFPSLVQKLLDIGMWMHPTLTTYVSASIMCLVKRRQLYIISSQKGFCNENIKTITIH